MNKLLILSVGYGKGHHAAAAALSEEFSARGWSCCTADPCAEAHPLIFSLTQRFYDFCVRRAPWLWSITYAQTDTADWSRAVHWPVLRGVTKSVQKLLEEMTPDVVLCTYPLYAYMLDKLCRCGLFHGNYAVVVTDALVISRPWVLSSAPMLVVPDEYSKDLVCARYGLGESVVSVGGFPVKKAFSAVPSAPVPTENGLHILFGAFRPARDVACTVRSILSRYPTAHVTLLGGGGCAALRRLLAPELKSGAVELLSTSRNMSRLMAQSHVYIGKAGAATMFECYAAALPMLVNYALPGQEQGNLELLLKDGAGLYADSPEAIVSALHLMLAEGAAKWQTMRQAMAAAHRKRGGAARIADVVERSLNP